MLERLALATRRAGSPLCLGLDVVPADLPRDRRNAPKRFLHDILEACLPHVAAVKLNPAFFLALGTEGGHVMAEVRDEVPKGVPVILDGKYADVAHTCERYADYAFDVLGCDAVTANPYMGRDAIDPFLSRKGRGVFLLVRTSNPNSYGIQGLHTAGLPLFAHVAGRMRRWGDARLGAVAAANDTNTLREVRRVLGEERWILAPGVGPQGGDAAAAYAAGANRRGTGVLLVVARSVLHASRRADFAEAAARECRRLADAVKAAGSSPRTP
ncbi:MAG: orotidine-5'-phosphate decarboxylase [Methanobacteriota archaeon]